MTRAHGEAGLTLVEVMIALVILSIGIMALGRILPAGSRSELSSKMMSAAGQYNNEVFESLRGLAKTDAKLSLGRHPASAFDTLGTKKSFRRYYVVSQMASPLDSLYKVDATVLWTSSRTESLRISGYLMP